MNGWKAYGVSISIYTDTYICMCVCVERETYIYTHNRILLSFEKEGNLAICNNIDGAWWYHAKRNNPDRER